MSCMMLPPEHFAAIVGSVQAHISGSLVNSGSLKNNLVDSANELAEANLKAWKKRYSSMAEDRRAAPAKVPAITSRMIEAFLLTPLSVDDTNQAIRCYQYQACEWEYWEGSEAERSTLYMQRALLDVASGSSDVWVITSCLRPG